jgi:hypothetical protein
MILLASCRNEMGGSTSEYSGASGGCQTAKIKSPRWADNKMANLAETGIHFPLAAGFSPECISKIGFWLKIPSSPDGFAGTRAARHQQRYRAKRHF